MQFWQRKICIGVALFLAGAWLAPVCVSAYPATRSRAKTTAVRKAHSPQRSGMKQTAQRKSSKKTTRVSSRRKRPPTHRQIRARLHLQPDRIEEIQQALSKAGYLNAEPTGQWDGATRSAMARYQSDQGFPATGLPEAKSLMKLGLGPHPLPPDLDPSVAARANAESAPTPTPPQDASPRRGDPPGSPPDNK